MGNNSEKEKTKEPGPDSEAFQADDQNGLQHLEMILDVPLQVSAELGRSKVLIKELLHLREGSVIELDKLAGEPLDVYVNSRLIARAEAVIVNEKIGLRLTDVVSPTERLERLR